MSASEYASVLPEQRNNPKAWPTAGIVMSSILLAGWVVLSNVRTIRMLFNQSGILPSNI